MSIVADRPAGDKDRGDLGHALCPVRGPRQYYPRCSLRGGRSLPKTGGRFPVQVIEHFRPGVVILEPRGRITVETEHDLREAVRRQIDAGRTHLVLDLTCVPYIDSCGLGRIVQGYVSARNVGGDLKLMNVTGRNRQLLTVTRLLFVFEIYEPSEVGQY